jgi:hypothetical protein
MFSIEEMKEFENSIERNFIIHGLEGTKECLYCGAFVMKDES